MRSEEHCIYEVYESHHFKQVKEDLERQQNIREALKSDFRIVYDRNSVTNFIIKVG